MTSVDLIARPLPEPRLMNQIDTIMSELANCGWSVGDTAYRETDNTVQQVYGHWQNDKVLSRAPDQTTAWRLAAEQIVELRQLAFCARMMAIDQLLRESPLDRDRERLLEETDRLEYEFGRDDILARDALTQTSFGPLRQFRRQIVDVTDTSQFGALDARRRSARKLPTEHPTELQEVDDGFRALVG